MVQMRTQIHIASFKMNYFYDYGRGEADSQLPKIYQSVGWELTADFHLYSLPTPLDMGLRYAYRFEEEDSRFEAVVNLSLAE